MATPFQFDKAVLQVVADDKQMVNTLKKDEALVNRSVTKMQGDLNKLSVSMGTTGDAGQVAAGGVTALSAAAAATGNASLASGAQVANLGLALKVMGNQALGAKAQLLAMAAATLEFVAANKAALGILGLLVAAIVAVRVVKSRAAQKELDELKEIEEASNRSLTRLEKELKHKQGLAAITDKIAVAEGKLSKEQARLNELRRADRGAPLRQLEERVAAETKLATVVAANAAKAAAAIKARADAEQQAVKQKQEALNLATQQAAAEQRITDEVVRRHEARFVAPFEGRGVTTAAEAQRLVTSTLGLVEANQRSAALTTAAFNRLTAQAARFGLDEAMLAKLQQALGVPGEADKPSMRFGAGAVAVSGFAATGTKGIAGLSSVERGRETREQRQATDIEKTRIASERTADAISNITLGAG